VPPGSTACDAEAQNAQMTQNCELGRCAKQDWAQQ